MELSKKCLHAAPPLYQFALSNAIASIVIYGNLPQSVFRAVQDLVGEKRFWIAEYTLSQQSPSLKGKVDSTLDV